MLKNGYTCVCVPLLLSVVCTIRVKPGAEESRILVRHEHLTANCVAFAIAKTKRHLELPKSIERVYQVHVIVQIDAAEMHEQHNAPEITSLTEAPKTKRKENRLK